MMGFGIMGFGWLFGILIIGGVVWFIAYALKKNNSGERDRKSDAGEILKERFARGEIGQEEYEKKREILSR